MLEKLLAIILITFPDRFFSFFRRLSY